MIIEFFLNIIVGFISTGISGLGHVITLPINLITVLADIWGYGCFILGPDLFVICMSSFFFWFMARFLIGLITFIWHLIPLC